MNKRLSRAGCGVRVVGLWGTMAAAALLCVGALGMPGCEKPAAKAEKLVMSGDLIGVTIEEGNKIVGMSAIMHDEFNYYWDFGPGNGVIQVLVRGGKISRVDREESFQPRQARDNTTPEPFVPAEQRENPLETDDGAGGGG